MNELIGITVFVALAYIFYKVFRMEGVSFNKGVITKRKYIEFNFEDSDKTEGEYIVVDIETTGLPKDRTAKPENFSNWPYIVQIGWLLFDDEGKCIEYKHHILNQDTDIPRDSIAIHGITNEIAKEKGVNPKIAYNDFVQALKRAKTFVSHNTDFDGPIIECELLRNGFENHLIHKRKICTMKRGKDYCQIGGYHGDYKYPKLQELYLKCFYPDFDSVKIKEYINLNGNLPNKALIDASMAAKCFFKLKELNIIKDY